MLVQFVEHRDDLICLLFFEGGRLVRFLDQSAVDLGNLVRRFDVALFFLGFIKGDDGFGHSSALGRACVALDENRRSVVFIFRRGRRGVSSLLQFLLASL